MGKYYQVIKDTPAWEVGAIIQQGTGDESKRYYAISDLWDTPAATECTNYYEAASVVENAPDYFQRVYEISVLGKAKYLVKDQAKKAHDKLYKES